MLSKAKSMIPAETEAVATRCIKAAIAVHRALGPGLLEGMYQDALGIELGEEGLKVEREKVVPIQYRSRPIRPYRLDMIVDGVVLLELKAVERFEDVHYAQVLTYLRCANLRLGLLMNFNAPTLKAGLRRFVR